MLHEVHIPSSDTCWNPGIASRGILDELTLDFRVNSTKYEQVTRSGNVHSRVNLMVQDLGILGCRLCYEGGHVS